MRRRPTECLFGLSEYPTFTMAFRSQLHVRPSTLLLCLLAVSGALTACGGSGDVDDTVVAESSTSTPAASTEDNAEALISTSTPSTDTEVADGSASDADMAPTLPEETILPPEAQYTETMATAQANSTANCSIIPAIPAVPSGAKLVTAFGATPNDSTDDTAAIQKALDGMKSGEWLVFPSGKYLINKSIKLKVANTTVYGAGATIHATNPTDQAIWIQADGVRVYSFTKTAVTTTRQTTPWSAGMTIYASNADGSRKAVNNVVIQGNKIINAGTPGTNLANSAGSAGIIILKGYRFLVANNTVQRSLADAIHITSGSRDGRVIGNTVRENGDDMVAVVSYAAGGSGALGSGSKTYSDWTNKQASGINKNMYIANNDLAGQYWGRGITMIGADGVTVRNNKVYNSPMGAGILLAREASYQTFGTRNILIDGNTIDQTQTMNPPYNPGNKFTTSKITGHGAIEIHSVIFKDEAAIGQLSTDLAVRNVAMVNNKITEVDAPGMRIGQASGSSVSAVDPATGKTVTRSTQAGRIENLALEKTAMNGVHHRVPMSISTTTVQTTSTWCSGNTNSGSGITSGACKMTAKPAVTGATLSCTSTGQTG
jgi:hypothetical protein